MRPLQPESLNLVATTVLPSETTKLRREDSLQPASLEDSNITRMHWFIFRDSSVGEYSVSRSSSWLRKTAKQTAESEWKDWQVL